MITALFMLAPGLVEVVHVAEVGATTFKPTVFGTPGCAYDHQDVATESFGVFALTLTNLVIGSSIQIEDQSGTTTFYNGTAAGTSQLINLDAFAPGSSLNDLRIKVRKGSSAPYYQPYETLATASVGAQSIYVSQIKDD